MNHHHGRRRPSLEDLQRKQAAMLEKYGWMVHYVFDDDESPNRTNYHTHGIADNFNHPDLQICLPIQPEVAHGLFEAAIDNIKKGVAYTANIEYDNILAGGFKVKFMETQDGSRKVLRMLIPDENGKYEAPFYKEQLNVRPNHHQAQRRR